MTTLTKEKVLKLAESHIKMYERRIAHPSPPVNVEQCQYYLRIWQSIKEKGGENLIPVERGEILDAIDSGEYDRLLGIQDHG
jgi:hypothetical protein